MRKKLFHTMMLMGVLGLGAFALTACEKSNEDKVEDAVNDAADAAEDSADEVGDAMDDATGGE